MKRLAGLAGKAWRAGLLVSVGAGARYLTQIVGRRNIRAAGFVHLQRGARVIVEEGATLVVGRNVLLKYDSVVYVKKGAYLELGDRFALGHHGEISVNERVTIGPATFTAPFAYITDSNHRFDRLDMPVQAQPMEVRPTSIGRDVWIARSAMILAGASVPDQCVVGAGAVVTRKFEPGDVIVGVPARAVRNRLNGTV